MSYRDVPKIPKGAFSSGGLTAEQKRRQEEAASQRGIAAWAPGIGSALGGIGGGIVGSIVPGIGTLAGAGAGAAIGGGLGQAVGAGLNQGAAGTEQPNVDEAMEEEAKRNALFQLMAMRR